MAFIIDTVTSFPEYYLSKKELKLWLSKVWPSKTDFIEQTIEDNMAESRYFSLPQNYYRDLHDVGKRNVIWKAEACRLQKQNIQKLLDKTHLDISDIDLIASVTTTGLAVPSLEALMMNEFPFSPYTKRLPIFGLGSLGAIAGINRVHDFLKGNPDKAALLMVTELNSLNFQMEDESFENVEATTLHGDGSGLILMVGNDHPLKAKARYEIVDQESIFYRETERMITCDVVEEGVHLAAASDMSLIMKEKISLNIDQFLKKNNKSLTDILFYAVHPNDIRFLQTFSTSLNLYKDELEESLKSLAKYGNLSAVSLCNIIEQTMSKDIAPGQFGLLMSTGPALSLELSLIKTC